MAFSTLSEGVTKEMLDEPDPETGLTALQTAVLHRELGLAMVLAIKGANVNVSDPSTGETPLHVAAASGSLQMVCFLVKAGANPSCPDRKQRAPSAMATGPERKKMVELLETARKNPQRARELIAEYKKAQEERVAAELSLSTPIRSALERKRGKLAAAEQEALAILSVPEQDRTPAQQKALKCLRSKIRQKRDSIRRLEEPNTIPRRWSFFGF